MLERDYDAPSEAYEAVLDAVRQTTPCVIADLPHSWTPWIRQAMVGADDIVIVATPDLASLRNAKNIVELVRGQRPNDNPPRLILNQVGVPKRPEIPAKDFAETLNVHPSAVIAFEPALFGQAANNGQMLMDVQPKSAVAQHIHSLAELLTGRQPQAAKKAGNVSLFSRLKKRA
jgi:pilus assembly protein CpaE